MPLQIDVMLSFIITNMILQDTFLLVGGDSIARNVSTVFKYNQKVSVECFQGIRVLDISAHMENAVENH